MLNPHATLHDSLAKSEQKQTDKEHELSNRPTMKTRGMRPSRVALTFFKETRHSIYIWMD